MHDYIVFLILAKDLDIIYFLYSKQHLQNKKKNGVKKMNTFSQEHEKIVNENSHYHFTSVNAAGNSSKG
jgi:hypothetical protein